MRVIELLGDNSSPARTSAAQPREELCCCWSTQVVREEESWFGVEIVIIYTDIIPNLRYRKHLPRDMRTEREERLTVSKVTVTATFFEDVCQFLDGKAAVSCPIS